ncbi:hypothetical protein [Pseudobacteriovorax antillogorgiicola]|uniref:Plastocyanin n=1 Tax=Pseudobacteriovorax antillogorgiicola TaxID=1513793 RepID=A0A1Y6CNZ2_9BACT|nr:hypothetical protein [Pseudobacteriovorax antillogorgiicola]TCS47327.1 plastocyanin [Pseudobacteriovorax antillogorgiicola]SMF62953.1 Plastocyanin [Pseudobacteriovorax antillogorgiicola]
MRKKIVTLVLGFLPFAGLSAVAKEHTIKQKNKQFSQKEIKLKVGESLKFTNEDNTTHHIMMKVDGKRISQKQVEGAAPIVQTFSKPQETTVRCAIHPKMMLKVTVEP